MKNVMINRFKSFLSNTFVTIIQPWFDTLFTISRFHRHKNNDDVATDNFRVNVYIQIRRLDLGWNKFRQVNKRMHEFPINRLNILSLLNILLNGEQIEKDAVKLWRYLLRLINVINDSNAGRYV